MVAIPGLTGVVNNTPTSSHGMWEGETGRRGDASALLPHLCLCGVLGATGIYNAQGDCGGTLIHQFPGVSGTARPSLPLTEGPHPRPPSVSPENVKKQSPWKKREKIHSMPHG